jgi:hypothetical protein
VKAEIRKERGNEIVQKCLLKEGKEETSRERERKLCKK